MLISNLTFLTLNNLQYFKTSLTSFIPSLSLIIFSTSFKSFVKIKFSILSIFLKPFSFNSFLTPEISILSNLSMLNITVSLFSLGILKLSKILSNIFLLFTLIINLIFSFENISEAMASISASASMLELPIVSTSHCVNSLYLAVLIGPSLNTCPISYLLNGIFKLGFIEIYLAKGTVKSYLKAKSLFPWSFNLKVSFKISFPPAYFAARVSYLSKIVVCRGLKPYFSKISVIIFIILFTWIFSSIFISLVPFGFCIILKKGDMGELNSRLPG